MARTIQSLDRGLQVIESLAQCRSPKSVTEIANEIGIDKSSAHRLLTTLVNRHFVYQEVETRKYLLGPKLIELGMLF